MRKLIVICSMMLFLSGCVSGNVSDPWEGNLFIAKDGEKRQLDPLKEELYESPTEKIDDIVGKMPYSFKQLEWLPFDVTGSYGLIRLFGTQCYDCGNKLGNDQGAELTYVNKETSEVVTLTVNRIKDWIFPNSDQVIEGPQLDNGAQTYILEKFGTLFWKQDKLNYEVSGGYFEENNRRDYDIDTLVKIANSIK